MKMWGTKAWNGYGRLLVASIEILASFITCYKVKKGSEAVFAYKLMTFTFLQGISNLVYEFKDQKIKEYLGDINYFLEQRNLENMREVEKKDAENVLKAYRSQCNDALDMCRKSGKKK